MAIVADIENFHAHVYFDADTRATAERVHDALAQRFDVRLGAFHSRPIGPHTKGMFQVTIAPEQFATIVPWLMLHRDGLSVLVHPTTDDIVADHESNAFWMGDVIAIDIERVREHVRAMNSKNNEQNEKEVGT